MLDWCNIMKVNKLRHLSMALPLVAAALASVLPSADCRAQAPSTVKPQVEIFAGVDLQYRDIYFTRLFDVLLSVTPGARWRFAPGWDATAQIYVPVYNDYGARYSRPRLGIASLSRQGRVGNRLALKGSAGLFSDDRYGFDLKALYALTPWLALEAQGGLTGYARITAFGWEASTMRRLTFLGGGAIYIAPVDVEMRVRAGRYAHGDWGCDAEGMRHFKHTTVGFRARWSRDDGPAFGFRVTVALPPYTRSGDRKVLLRPASDFQLSYINRAGTGTNTVYRTDPEESARSGWFDPEVAPWGLQARRQDFIYTDSIHSDRL